MLFRKDSNKLHKQLLKKWVKLFYKLKHKLQNQLNFVIIMDLNLYHHNLKLLKLVLRINVLLSIYLQVLFTLLCLLIFLSSYILKED